MLRTDTAGEKAADAAFPSTPTQDDSTAPSPFALREELIDLLRRDLLGPADGPEEEIPTDSRLTQRYLVGSLAPGGCPPDAAFIPAVPQMDIAEPNTEADILSLAGTDDPDAPAEREPVLVDSLLPSSAGFPVWWTAMNRPCWCGPPGDVTNAVPPTANRSPGAMLPLRSGSASPSRLSPCGCPCRRGRAR